METQPQAIEILPANSEVLAYAVVLLIKKIGESNLAKKTENDFSFEINFHENVFELFFLLKNSC